jgi:hypothetical protein
MQKEVKRLLNVAIRLEGKMKATCGAMADNLQPYFVSEISVDYQPGNGFCVIWEDDQYKAPNNVPVKEVLENMKKDETLYLF